LQTECQRIVDVSNDFLRFARIRELPLEPCDLAKVVEEMIDFFGPTARAANIEIKAFFPCDLPAVRLHKDMFKQALLNLMLNAEQALPEGGLITVQASFEECERENHVCLSLIDTGKGMPPEVVARVFEPFFSTKPGGTGLGLATTRKIVEAHHGSIGVQSEAGRGTKFTIRLPVA
jgi:signal transduction histidine kinase